MCKETCLEAIDMDDSYVWGCAFCRTGTEIALAEQMNELEEIRAAFAVKQMQHKSEGGKRTDVLKVMLPGYVFFLAKQDMETYRIRRNTNVLRLLTYEDEWSLRGDDLSFAKWMHEHGGILGVSKVFRVGQRIVIDSGPLKELEGVIQKVDRHNRNGLVSITFGGKVTKVWLAFEYVSEERQ